MSADTFVRLIEEMVDLKVQLPADVHLKMTPELAELLQRKRETDQRRLEQIRVELIRILTHRSGLGWGSFGGSSTLRRRVSPFL